MKKKKDIPFNFPDRKYCDGDKVPITMRLPKKLLDRVNEVADGGGWAATDVVATALDQFVQWTETKKK